MPVTKVLNGVANFQVDVMEGERGRGWEESGLNVQLTLTGEEVNMSTAPNGVMIIFFSAYFNKGRDGHVATSKHLPSRNHLRELYERN